jgi:hypothetical protein
MPNSHPDDVANWPLYWFARLESALERHDDRAAAEAIRKLESLGIEIRFRVPVRRAGRGGGVPAGKNKDDGGR